MSIKNSIYFLAEVLSKSKAVVFITRVFFRVFFALTNFLRAILISFEDRLAIENISKKISPTNHVISGPFQGQKFFNPKSIGSSYLPKLLGSYECELHDLWYSIKKKDFELIIDIGCAEGYYAIALAILYPNSIVYAFDTDSSARKYSKQNADANNVSNIVIGSLCSSQFIESTCKNKPSLIVCDIEGAEKDLFLNTDLDALSNSSLLIELHDGVDREISTSLKRHFLKSHDITSFFSTDDIHRPYKFSYFNTMKLSEEELFLSMQEKRGHIMEWIFCTPR